MRLTLSEVARVAGARLVLPGGTSASAAVVGVTIDSRRVGPGDLFVAIRGERLDGHDFLPGAFQAGAAAAMVSPSAGAFTPAPTGGALGPLLEVEDPFVAIRRLAAWIRDAVDPVVVGVTGSTGKTSTKDLIAAVSAVKHTTVAAHRSENNELGVPLTLLRASEETEVLVCELGARGPGQIRELCGYVRPRIGVVTNVGVTHYEQFGSVEAIVAAKSELPAALPEGGVAVLNADDPAVAGMAAAAVAEVVTYGTGPGAWLRAQAVEVDARGRPSFELVRGRERARVALRIAGRHQVHNALAAAATGLALGLTLEEVGQGLRQAQHSPWRMEVAEHGEVVVVNDAYNANPTSAAAALDTCAAMVPAGGRLVCILGYMAELGDLEVPEHQRLGRLAAAAAQHLIVVGDRARPSAAGAHGAGLSRVTVVAGAEPGTRTDAVLDALGTPLPGDVILIKGSRVAGLERVAAALAARLGAVRGEEAVR